MPGLIIALKINQRRCSALINIFKMLDVVLVGVAGDDLPGFPIGGHFSEAGRIHQLAVL